MVRVRAVCKSDLQSLRSAPKCGPVDNVKGSVLDDEFVQLRIETCVHRLVRPCKSRCITLSSHGQRKAHDNEEKLVGEPRKAGRIWPR